MISPTSKASLKNQCLILSKGKVEDAEKLYDFYIKDMEELPLFDIPQPSVMDNVKGTVGEVLGWFKDNKDDIAQGIEMFRSIKNGKVPPVDANVTPLPPINS